MINLDTHELAWCAGFFDGEGSTTIQKNGTGGSHIYIRVGQKEKELLIRFNKAINNCGRIYYDEHYDNRNARKASIYRLVIYDFEHTQHIMCLMWKWLGPFKKEQYRKAHISHLLGIRKPSTTKGAIRHRVRALKRERIKEKRVLINPFEAKIYG
jgi:hypothetical protein